MNTNAQETASDRFRLSPEQRRLWSERRNGEQFWSSLQIDIVGPVSVRRLRSAIRQVIMENETLRTRFEVVPALRYPCQIVGEPDPDHPGQEDASIACDVDSNQPEITLIERNSCKWSVSKSAKGHVLRVTFPSLCADQESLSVLFTDLADAYQSNKKTSSRPAGVQFVDYSEWRNLLLAEKTELSSAAGAFFSRYLSACPDAFELPFEQKHATGGGFRSETVTLNSNIALKLQELMPENGILEYVLFTAWAIMLSRMSGNSSIAFVACHDGRTAQEIRNAIGPFENWILHWVVVNERQQFRSALLEAISQWRDVEAYQDYYDSSKQTTPFSDTQQLTSFSCYRYPEPVQMEESRWSILSHTHEAGNWKLQLKCGLKGGIVSLELAYQTAVYRADTIRILLGTLSNLLTSIATSAPGSLLGVLETEGHPAAKMLEDQALQEPLQIVKQLSRWAEVCGERRAIVDKSGSKSYAELHRDAARLGAMLQQRGIKADSVVVLLLPRSSDAVTAMVGVLCAGAAYVVVDPSQPREWIRSQLTVLSPDAVVTSQEHLPVMLEPGETPWCTNTILLELLDHMSASEALQMAVSDPEALAYVVSTSGSTGDRKNVGITHRNIASYVEAICRKLKIKTDGSEPLNFALVSALHADLGYTVIYPALVSGGCLHILSDEHRSDPEAFGSYLLTNGIDVLKITPSHLKSLIPDDTAPILPRRALIAGGELFPLTLARRLSSTHSKCEVLNHYGPTETTIGCLMHRFEPERTISWASSVPIGKAFGWFEVYILSKQLSLLPPGTQGELYVAGEGVARGYLKAPGSTAASFLPDPFGSPGSRMYKTGDIVRKLPDGEIEFLRRGDDQIKIRGYRVEPAEVEATLAGCPGVRQALVLGVQDAGGSPSLVAYCVANPGSPLTFPALFQYVEQRLPAYMIPSAIHQITSIPLTSNGKVDRNALTKVAGTAAPDCLQVKPRTAAERAVAAIWEEVLNRKDIGLFESFFRLGGHSLLATQIVARIRKRLQVELPLSAFFEDATINGNINAVAAMWSGRDLLEQFLERSIQAAGQSGLAPECAHR